MGRKYRRQQQQQAIPAVVVQDHLPVDGELPPAMDVPSTSAVPPVAAGLSVASVATAPAVAATAALVSDTAAVREKTATLGDWVAELVWAHLWPAALLVAITLVHQFAMWHMRRRRHGELTTAGSLACSRDALHRRDSMRQRHERRQKELRERNRLLLEQKLSEVAVGQESSEQWSAPSPAPSAGDSLLAGASIDSGVSTATSTTPSSARSRNVLNKRAGGGGEAGSAPTAIKESSESSQATIDDDKLQDGDKALKHENTVVRSEAAPAPSGATAVGGMAGLAGVATRALAGTGAAAQHQHQQQQGAAPHAAKQEVMRATQQMLDSIAAGDFDSKLCDTNMTCFEPEALGNLIQGLEFHKFYFDHADRTGAVGRPVHTTMLNPQVHIFGDDAASVCYVRLTQFVDRSGEARTRQSQETRVWHKRAAPRGWQCVHVHRSGPAAHTATGPPLF